MENIKVIFYIAVAIGWLVLKNYKKVKQNKPVIKEVQEKPTSKESVLEKIPHTGWGEAKNQTVSKEKNQIKKPFEEYKKTKEVKSVASAVTGSRKTTSNLPFLTVDMPPSVSHDKSTVLKADEVEEKNKKIIEDDDFVIKNFDIRSAIIYSTILKRPEF